jgi:hypothetical protein
MRDLVAMTPTMFGLVRHQARKILISAMSWLAVERNRASIRH